MALGVLFFLRAPSLPEEDRVYEKKSSPRLKSGLSNIEMDAQLTETASQGGCIPCLAMDDTTARPKLRRIFEGTLDTVWHACGWIDATEEVRLLSLANSPSEHWVQLSGRRLQSLGGAQDATSAVAMAAAPLPGW